MSDERLMRRAITLSKRGYPAPNPHVGCVIAKSGEVVGEGWHEYAGGPHAEAVALHNAGDKARGATVYVTLEPCNHHGRTPPCSQALLEAGVKEVFVACPDPNPRARGGAELLRERGVGVHMGLCEDEAASVNFQFLFSMRHKRPLVVAKAAIGLDGRTSLASGESKWITSAEARKQVHKLRAELGSVLVGAGTVLADDPLLTARVRGVKNQPTRIILDSDHCLTGNERVFNQDAPTLCFAAEATLPHEVQAPLNPDGFNLPTLLRDLFERQITGVLVEGGPRTLSSFFRARLVDRIELFVAPKLLGNGPVWFNESIPSLDESVMLEIVKTRQAGPDMWLTARLA